LPHLVGFAGLHPIAVFAEMGVFTCVQCSNEYYSRRFFWEDADATEIASEEACEIAGTHSTCKLPESCLRYSNLSDLDLNSDRKPLGSLSEFLSGSASTSTMAASSESSNDDDEDDVSSADAQKAKYNWYSVDSPRASQRISTTVSEAYADVDCTPRSDVVSCQGPPTATAANADALRATGTAANIVGAAAPAMHFALAPFSAVGGAVGAVAGAYQLHEGLSAPSGITDPHLVTKGSVTAGVGTTCMALGIGAIGAPWLFVPALVLGTAGLGFATYTDATMGGLCPHCRDYGDVERNKELSQQDSVEEFCKQVPVEQGNYV